MANFGDRVRLLRTSKKLTVREMANKIFVDPTSISRWENGVNTAPQEMVLTLANFFNVSTDYLLGRTDDPRPFPVEDKRTIDEKWNDPNNDFLYAMYGEVTDLTEEQKAEILNFVQYLKSKEQKQ